MFGWILASKRQKALANLVSRVLDPVILVPLLLVLSASGAYVNGTRWRFLTFLILLDAVLPGFVLFYYIKKGKVRSGWDVEKREERVPLFFFVLLAHLAGVLIAWFLDKHPLAEYLMIFWALTLIYAMITGVWKISVHCGVLSALVTFVVLTMGVAYAPLYGLVLMIVWARVAGRHHRLAQAVVGAGVPVVAMPIGFFLMGLW